MIAAIQTTHSLTDLSDVVLLPDDAGYAPEIAPFNLALTHTPEIVVAATATEHVGAAIRYANANDVPVRVQSTGHAYKSIAGGMLISTRRMTRVEIDPASATAVVGAGVRWSAVIDAAAEFGLAPIVGSSPNVGVIGFLLGGGIGPLVRSHGVGSDYLLGATVVTGTGEIVETSVGQHPDLFWALQGGKVGLGIVTEVRIRLVPMPALYAGSLFFEEADIETAFRGWVNWTATAHEQVTTSIAIIQYPPLDFVPAPLRGRRVLSVRFAYPGSAEEGERLAAPLRAMAPVYIDALGEMNLRDTYQIHNDPPFPCPLWYRGMMLDRIDQTFATEMLATVGAGTISPFIGAEVRHIGGGVQSDRAIGSAVGGRDSDFTCSLFSMNQPDFDSTLPEAADAFMERIQLWRSEVINYNFAGNKRTNGVVPKTWSDEIATRLNGVRERYDPNGVTA